MDISPIEKLQNTNEQPRSNADVVEEAKIAAEHVRSLQEKVDQLDEAEKAATLEKLHDEEHKAAALLALAMQGRLAQTIDSTEKLPERYA